jgi:hypothetical protein
VHPAPRLKRHTVTVPLGGRIYFTDSCFAGTDRGLRTDLEGAGLQILVGSCLSGPRGPALAR